MVPFAHVLAPQQAGVPGGQQAPFPLSTVPDGQHTGAPDAVTTIRDVAQQFLLPGAPTMVPQTSPCLQHFLLPAVVEQQRDGSQHSSPQLTLPFGQHFPFEQTSVFEQHSEEPQSVVVGLHAQLPFTHA